MDPERRKRDADNVAHVARRLDHARSDTDACIVAGPGVDPVDVPIHALDPAPRSGKPCEPRSFEELPLFLQGAVLDHGRVAFARDPVGPAEYLRPWRKVWADQLARIRRHAGEAPTPPA